MPVGKGSIARATKAGVTAEETKSTKKTAVKREPVKVEPVEMEPVTEKTVVSHIYSALPEYLL
ncbi:MAG: hypothetical protein ACK5ML_07120 [Lachnospiraceae bacterium]